MTQTTNADRSDVAAAILIAMIESKVLAPDGKTSEEKAADYGKAFKALYEAVKQAEKGS